VAMRVLGIDPGLQITGYGCVEVTAEGHDAQLVEAGVFRLAAKRPMAERLVQLYDDVRAVLGELSPDVMVIEKLFSHYRHVRTAILMGHARGALMLAGQQAGVELDELAPTEVKKAMTGRGHASKRQMQEAVRAQLRLAELPEPADVADAIAIALCAARRIDAVRCVRINAES